MAAAKFLSKGSSSNGTKKQKQAANKASKGASGKMKGKMVKTPSTPTSASSTCSSQGTCPTAPTSPASTSSSSSPMPVAPQQQQQQQQQSQIHAQPPLVATSSTGSSSSGGGQQLSALVVLLESGDWAGAEARARSHPREAKVWATIKSRNSSPSNAAAAGDENAANSASSASKGAKRLPLHHACLKLRNVRCKLAAASTVQALLQAYPDAAKCRETRHGCLPLHLAAFSVSSTSSRISLTSSSSSVSAASLSAAVATGANRSKWEGTVAGTVTTCTTNTTSTTASTSTTSGNAQFPDRTTLMQNSVVAIVNGSHGTPAVEIKLTKSPSFNSDADSHSYTSENTGNKEGAPNPGPSSVSTPNSAGAGTNTTGPGGGTGSIGALTQVLNGEGKVSTSPNKPHHNVPHQPRRSPIPTGRTISSVSDDQDHKERQDRIATSIIQMIMDANPRAVKTDSEGGRLPLHMACSGRATPAVVATLLHAYPDACRHRNRDGFLPLHLVAYWGVSDERVAVMLLRAYPDAAVGRNKWGRIPLEEALHVAGENGRSHQDSLVRVLRKHPSYWSRPPATIPTLGTSASSTTQAAVPPSRSGSGGAATSNNLLPSPPSAAEPVVIVRRELWRNKSASNLVKDEGGTTTTHGIAPRPEGTTKRNDKRAVVKTDSSRNHFTDENRAESPSNIGWNNNNNDNGEEENSGETSQEEEQDKAAASGSPKHKKNLSCPSESELREVFGSFAFDWQCSERPGTGTGDTTTSEADWIIPPTSETQEFHNPTKQGQGGGGGGVMWDSKDTADPFAIVPPRSKKVSQAAATAAAAAGEGNNNGSSLAECTEVHVLIKAQEWTAVIQRCEIHPSEVGEWLTVKSQAGRTTRCSPLHYALERNPPCDTVEAILRVHPEASTWRANPSGELPLHVACTWGASPRVVQRVLEANVDAARGRDENGNLPLHDACYSGAAVEILDMLLLAYPKSVSVSNHSGSTPMDIIRRLDHENKEEMMDTLEGHAESMREEEGVVGWTTSNNNFSEGQKRGADGFNLPDWKATHGVVKHGGTTARSGGRSLRPDYV